MALAQVISSSDEIQRCIQNCRDCERVCLETLTYCLAKGGRLADGALVRLLLDCVDISRASSHFMLRGSELHSRVCFACAEVCARCAEVCESVGSDAQLRLCAETCRRCAESCRQMSEGVLQSSAVSEAEERAAQLPA